ncbi:MAG: hypothetical protein V7719_10295 [Psychroserpens sp.]|uniref:hypothetical protein n=1 Tax=Psychroserpens sp. TaxID=2020870 RepID=UPI00300278A3
MKKLNKDHKASILFFTLTLLFILTVMTNKSFFEWVFDRHHNQWSWYIRPLFLIPFCSFAYKRSWSGMAITLFCLFTSMFWFPIPEVISDQVKTFLQFEKTYLYGEWDIKKIMMTFTIPVSFFLLGLSFWKRNLRMGLSVLILIATGKIVWSIQNAGESGTSILIPAITGLLICCVVLFYGFRKMGKE